jgi:tRNA A-37 threonylcarbamoyl transferase component Bud32
LLYIDKDDYIKKLHSEMEQSQSYEETDADIINETMKRIRKLVNKMHREGVIHNELKQYLIPRYPTPGKLKVTPNFIRTMHR